MDALYVLTGRREEKRKAPKTAPDSAESTISLIDVQRLNRIAEMLEAAAKQAGKRWPARQLVSKTAEVYNFLAQEKHLDNSHVERVLKLVVSH